MDQPHRARELDLGRLDHDHLALDAAQLALRVARGQAAAIDHDAVEIVRVRVAAKFDPAAGLAIAACSSGSTRRGSTWPSSG